MVMKPEPWGEALDAVVPPDETDGRRATLVVPTPAGELFTQAVAADLATREHLVFACGRYEGIDQRVMEHAASRMEVRELSIGDYVLNGGEVAALAIVEAVVRLLPGFLGNAESLTEESHAAGLLEAPAYTKPEAWRGHQVPEVLLSGDHARVARWRHDESVRRTAERRPDLAHPSTTVDLGELKGQLRLAVPADAAELLTLQRACWLQEQQANPGVEIPALQESLADLQAWLQEWTTLVLRVQGRLIGAARAHRVGDAWDIGRIMVAPDLQGRGIGRLLLTAIEAAAPEEVGEFVLFTGAGSVRNIRMYKKAGYRLRGADPDVAGAVRLTKRRR
jgi:tRNA (guanine37-N1)-methyltransferase